MKLFSQKSSLREIVVPAEKKISTPAGQRLSHIMDVRAPPIPPRSALRNKNLHDVEESSTSSVLGGKGGQSYSNAWSDGVLFRKDAKLEALRNNRHIAKRGGWWRLILIVAIIIAAIIALALGLVFGLRKTKSDSRYDWLARQVAFVKLIDANFSAAAIQAAAPRQRVTLQTTIPATARTKTLPQQLAPISRLGLTHLPPSLTQLQRTVPRMRLPGLALRTSSTTAIRPVLQ